MKARKLLYALPVLLFVILSFLSMNGSAQVKKAGRKPGFTGSIKVSEAQNLIRRLNKSQNNYMVPEGWLFERDTLDSLFQLGYAGIRFYAGIIGKDTSENNPDTLTLIAVSVKLDNKEQNSGMYEYSDMCPPMCSYGHSGVIEHRKGQLLSTIEMPYAWYIPKQYFDNVFSDSNIMYVRLYYMIFNGYVHLRMVGARKETINGKVYYTDVEELSYPQPITELCRPTSESSCDTGSPLYMVK